MKVKSESEVTQSCPTLRDPTDCSPPGSSVHGISQARVLEWVAIAFSKRKHPREWLKSLDPSSFFSNPPFHIVEPLICGHKDGYDTELSPLHYRQNWVCGHSPPGNLQKKLFITVHAFTLKKTRDLLMRNRREWSWLRQYQMFHLVKIIEDPIQGLSVKTLCLWSALRNLLFLKNNCFLSIFSNLAPWNSIQSDSRPPGLNICVSYPFCSHFYHWFLLCFQRNHLDFILFLLKSYINWTQF